MSVQSCNFKVCKVSHCTHVEKAPSCVHVEAFLVCVLLVFGLVDCGERNYCKNKVYINPL